MYSGPGRRLGFGQAILVALITLYRFTLAGLLGGHCRFEPSCSRYGEQAIRKHGVLRGSYLTVRRILRCHPWSRPGWDPVPDSWPPEREHRHHAHGSAS